MKKILSLLLSALLVCSFFTSCEGEESVEYSGSEEKTYSGIVKVKIFNNADVPLVINKIEEGETNTSSYSSRLSSIYGTMNTETTIPANSNKDFEIECKKKSTYFYYSVDGSKFDCYYNSSSTVNYPYLGTITGNTVTKKSEYSYGSTTYYKSNTGVLNHDRLDLSSSSIPEINVILNFVKTTDGDYVLALVK